MQRAATVAFVGCETQVVDEDSECGKGEVMRQNHADAKRWARFTLTGSDRMHA
ncbi:MAG TPA: hypothetical protein VK676_11110 [Steroidobacteraceae bacterium]|nr:hypothetical protein [Steroidobacteraceae bacterium]